MGLATHTGLQHLSYQEIDDQCRRLSELIQATWYDRFDSLWYRDPRDAPIVAILSVMLDKKMAPGDKMFSLYSNVDVDFCFYRKVYESEHYNKTCKAHLEDLHEDNGRFTTFSLPWIK